MLHVITEESFLIEDEQNYMTILWQPSTHDNWKNILPTSSKKKFLTSNRLVFDKAKSGHC